MQKFSIFIKSSKFYWSTNKILYSILFLFIGLMLFKQKILNIEQNIIDKIFIWMTLGVLICGLVTKLIGFTKIEPLRGKVEGYLSFEKDSININGESYSLEKTNKIKITNDDYIGKLIRISGGNLGPALSNGTNNFIIVFFESYQTKQYRFQMIKSDDFQKVRHELISFHLNGKIEFDDLADVLGEKSTNEIKALKLEIEKQAF